VPNPIQLRGKRVLVVGLARTGVATALFCAVRLAEVTATDLRAEAEIPETGKLRMNGVALHLGRHDEGILDRQDLVVSARAASPSGARSNWPTAFFATIAV